MSVLVPPVLYDGRICRVVAPSPDLIFVEEWTGQYWQPSQALVHEVTRAPATSRRDARGQGLIGGDAQPPQPTIDWDSATALFLLSMGIESTLRVLGRLTPEDGSDAQSP